MPSPRPLQSLPPTFRAFVGAAYMRPANLPPHPVSSSPPCRGRACPARDLPPNPFHGQSVGEGFIPPGHLPAATNLHGGQRTGRPTTPLKNPCAGENPAPHCGASGTPPPTILAANLPPYPIPHPRCFCIFFTNFTVPTQNRGHLCKSFTAIVPHHGRYPYGNAVQWPCFR